MPSKKAYDLVSDDGYDSRIPLHNDEAFQHGLQFQAKYIGTLDVPRPSSRVEIVAAMRRVRYEFKAKSVKKKKVVLTISIEGVKVTLRKKKKSQWSFEDARLLIMQHPIYRIFYVSHDSQDLKIWSYIARDGPSNVFKCNVFKAYKKSQAMRIVRTIGQAFEVCHKLGGLSRPCSELKEDVCERSSEDNERRINAAKNNEIPNNSEKKELNRSPSKLSEAEKHKPTPPSDLSLAHGVSSKLNSPTARTSTVSESESCQQLPISQQHQMQLVRQQLEQQQHQTQIAIAQVHLLKDQLSAETAARIEAQARAHQLLLHNKDLLDHVTVLVSRVQALEMKVNSVSPGSTHTKDIFQISSQVSCLPDVSTPRPAPVYLPDMPRPSSQFLDHVTTLANPGSTGGDLDAESPDSGHREMSSESLSLANGDLQCWMNPYGSSSKAPSNFDTSREMNGWGSPRHSSSSPPSSSHSKSSTIKAGSVNSINEQRSNSNNSQTPSPYNNNAYSERSTNLYRSTSERSPSHKKEASDGVKLISSLASSRESCSSSHLEYKTSGGSNSALSSSVTSSTTLISSMSSSMSSSSTSGTAPKIDPPPKFRRTSRPIERWERGSWYNNGPDAIQNHGTSDSDYYSAYAVSSVGSNNSGAVVLRNHNRNTNVTSNIMGTPGAFRYSDSSARSSLCSENRDSISSYTALKQRLDVNINDLNTTHPQPQQNYQYSQNHSKMLIQPLRKSPQQPNTMQQQHPYHQIQNGKWKMRLSYTSDENSDASIDYNGVSSSTQTRLDRQF